MGEDAEVLRLRTRNLFDEPAAGEGLRGATAGGAGPWVEPWGGEDGPWPEPEWGYDAVGGLGDLTQVVLVGDQVVDVARRPISGSGYEGTALDLEDRGLYRRPAPPPVPRAPEPPAHEQQLAWLARIVGGESELMRLHTDPLELDELSLVGVREPLHERVVAIDERLSRFAPPLLGDEGLAAARRLLVRAVSREPALLTRSDRDDLATGAVLWAVAKGNDLVGTNRPVRASVIQDVCGLRSTPSQRGGGFAHAVGGSPRHGRPLWMFHAEPDVIPLGSPDLLLARFRRTLVVTRDLALGLRARTPPVG